VILVDISIWLDHLRSSDTMLAALLERGEVLAHPFVTGELALGNLRQREIVLAALCGLPHATIASEAEILGFIERHSLFGLGIGYVDAHLLAATRLTADALLWTRDTRLANVALRLDLAMRL
jgi:predicted nucleic acid-binding protein